ncbi:MAG: M4 family metallopeptidase [Anaerolineales bacterium]|nr:M4 family metallopeptidase [Anaerolineales bacterium]
MQAQADPLRNFLSRAARAALQILTALVFALPPLPAWPAFAHVEDQRPPLAPATTCGGAFPATADATISQAAPAATYGLDDRLQVSQAQSGEQHRALLAFDLSSLPAGVTIHQALLLLDTAERGYARDETFRAAAVLDAWAEEQLTWNTRPAAPVSRALAVASSADGTLSVDVTTQAQALLGRRDGGHGLALLPAAAGVEVTFHSRETTATGVSGPRLVVRCAPRREPVVTDAGPADAAQAAALDLLRANSRLPVTMALRDGAVSALDLALSLPAGSGSGTVERARWFLNEYRDLLRLPEPDHELQHVRVSRDGEMAFFRQTRQGIPVYGSHAAVWVHDNEVRYVGGTYLPDIGVAAEPRLSAEQAEAVALALAGAEARPVGDTQLSYFNEGLFAGQRAPTYLAWVVNLDVAGVVQPHFIDAENGQLLYQPAVEEDIDVHVFNANHAPLSLGCSAVMMTLVTLEYTELGPVAGNPSPDSQDAFENFAAVYSLWKNVHNHLSYDGHDSRMDLFTEVGIGYGSARSLGSCLLFGQDRAKRDIVGHEFAHSVDSEHGKLVYMDESGALDESFADIFGYFADPDDWLVADEWPNGPIRSLQDPPAYGDPDRYADYVEKPFSDDNGGVHTNSGIHNKAAYLVIAGGQHNGHSIAGIGGLKAGRLYYNLLTSGVMGGTTLKQAAALAIAFAKAWAEAGKHLFTPADLCSVRNAYAAVGLAMGDGDMDCDGIVDGPDNDLDGDGKADGQDNCTLVFNPTQQNTDQDDMGDACDPNDDNDAKDDEEDNCPKLATTFFPDWNDNGIGDYCEDSDGDFEVDAYDNCRTVPNGDQADLDKNGIGDVCDVDMDGDGVMQPPWANPGDNCPRHENTDQADSDLDGHGDACDLCPGFSHADNSDTDSDGVGDPCDSDDDNDGSLDWWDNCPKMANPDQADLNQNNVGYACDPAEQAYLRQLHAQVHYDNQLIPLDLPSQLDLPIFGACGNCGGPVIIHPGFEVRIDVSLGAAVYARVLDSQGNVAAQGWSSGAGGVQLAFEPAAYSYLPGAGAAEIERPDLPHDRTAYTLEVFALEDPNGDRTYDLALAVSQGHQVLLPLAVR